MLFCAKQKNVSNNSTHQKTPWTHEEIIFLLETRGCPNFYENWRQHAKKNGWTARGRQSIQAKLQHLEKKGVLRETDWLTQYRLSHSLGVSESTIAKWRESGGLRFERNSENPDIRTPYKVRFVDFLKWATSDGKHEVAKALNNDRLAVTWFLTRLGELINKEERQ